MKKMLKKWWFWIIVVVIFFTIFIIFSEDTLSESEQSQAINDLNSIYYDLIKLEIDIVDTCDEIYGKDNSSTKCETYYNGISITKKYINDLKNVLETQDGVLREPFESSINDIKEAMIAVENSRASLNDIKELKNGSDEIKDNSINDDVTSNAKTNNNKTNGTNKNTNSGTTNKINDNKTNSSNSETSTTNANSVPKGSQYEVIYNEYSARLRNECPSLSITECAEISNEGIEKMAEYMYKAKGTEGQYTTYSNWASKLMNVYVNSAR